MADAEQLRGKVPGDASSEFAFKILADRCQIGVGGIALDATQASDVLEQPLLSLRLHGIENTKVSTNRLFSQLWPPPKVSGFPTLSQLSRVHWLCSYSLVRGTR